MKPEVLLVLAQEVAEELEGLGVTPLVVGAVAMAARGYERATDDLDFGVNLSRSSLEELARSLERRGIEVSLREPDGDDPLGGVLEARRGDERVEVVSFDNPPSGGFPRLVADALKNATKVDGLPGVVASTLDLILFKLYAGGPKSRNDVLHMLEAIELDLEEITKRASSAGVLKREWTRILRDLETE